MLKNVTYWDGPSHLISVEYIPQESYSIYYFWSVRFHIKTDKILTGTFSFFLLLNLLINSIYSYLGFPGYQGRNKGKRQVYKDLFFVKFLSIVKEAKISV